MKSETVKLPFGGSLTKSKSRNGHWWYQFGSSPNRIRRTTGTADYDAAVEKARSLASIVAVRSVAAHSMSYRSDFHEVVRNAAKNAKKKGVEFRLSDEDVDALIDDCQHACAVTGLAFQRIRGIEKYQRQPFMPSLDRIDSTEGYHYDNCRFVCTAANYALNTWGEWVLHELARALYSTNRIPKSGRPILRQNRDR